MNPGSRRRSLFPPVVTMPSAGTKAPKGMEWTTSLVREGSSQIVVKGGSWDYITLASLKVASRGSGIAQSKSENVGVRCIK